MKTFPQILLPALSLLLIAGNARAQQPSSDFPEWTPSSANRDAAKVDWAKAVPQVIHPDKNLVKLYNAAWQITASRIRTGEFSPIKLPASPYLDENVYDDQIWIWDSAFMVLYSRYAPSVFPGLQTLDNIYHPIHKQAETGLKVHLCDNPPILAWAEYSNYVMSADKKRMEQVMDKENFLEKHFEFFQTAKKGSHKKNASPQSIVRGVVRIAPSGKFIAEDEPGYRETDPFAGFTWSRGASGMDNTPRNPASDRDTDILWVDALAQQAFSALCIARIHESRGQTAKQKKWLQTYHALKKIVNQYYWDEEDGFYYDLSRKTGTFSKVKTCASYWVMMAEIPSREQAARMIKYLQTDSAGFSELGGKYPFVSLSRKHPLYNQETGDYWRGGIWMPLAYMTTKSLEKYGYDDLADELAGNIIRQILNVYLAGFDGKHTIWECYSPSQDRPSTEHGRTARPDFCGWSALGPISMFIENVMGFHNINGLKKRIDWNLKASNGTHGIKNLRFANITTDIVYDSGRKEVDVRTNAPYTLVINGEQFKITPVVKKIKPSVLK